MLRLAFFSGFETKSAEANFMVNQWRPLKAYTSSLQIMV